MKSKVIRIKPELFERLKFYAVPLQDTPSDVIERILDEYEKLKQEQTKKS